MSKILLKNIKFLHEINEFYNKNKDKIIDIILFGSVLKGKENPRDIDLLILFKEKKNLDLSYELKKRLKNFNLDINSKSYNELFDTYRNLIRRNEEQFELEIKSLFGVKK